MISRAAISINDTVYSLPKPNRHHHVIRYAIAEGVASLAGIVEGFLTDADVFLSRDQACRHAIACGQVAAGNLVRAGSLSTDDLW